MERVRLLLRNSLVLALVYCAYVMASRYFGSKRIESPKRDAGLDSMYSGDALKILHFYTSTPQVRAGEPATLCYGVLNAKAVKIEPAVDGVSPALSRCVTDIPQKTTRYKLSAQGKDGIWVEATAEVRVLTPRD